MAEGWDNNLSALSGTEKPSVDIDDNTTEHSTGVERLSSSTIMHDKACDRVINSDDCETESLSEESEVVKSSTDTESDAVIDAVPSISESTIENLSSGLLQHFLPEFKKGKVILDELIENQRIIIETVQQENAKFQESSHLSEITATMTKAKLYHAKLVHIKKEMASTHERVSKLKHRALRLQQQKQKEALEREQDRDREICQEQLLVAKRANSSSKPIG